MKHENPQPKTRRFLGHLAKPLLENIGVLLEDGIVGSSAQIEKARLEVPSVGVLKDGVIYDLDPVVAPGCIPDTALVRGIIGPNGSAQDVAQIIYAGETVFAVVRTTSGTANHRTIVEIALVELPYGHYKKFAADPDDLSPTRVIHRVDPKALSNNLVEGNVQQWDTITVGRRANEKPDLAVSNIHFKFTVMVNGATQVEHVSTTNPTTVLTEQTYDEIQGRRKVMPTETEKLVADLAKYPNKFNPDYAAGKSVTN